MSVHVAVAHSNIALAKYWGKADARRMLPAVPSLSMTLEALRTQTRVTLDAQLPKDELWIDGRQRSGRELSRVTQLLDSVRQDKGSFARVESENSFETAAGLASSASGFAALAVAARAAFGYEYDAEKASQLAQSASISAARSIYGGYVELPAETLGAKQVAPGEHWPLILLIALTAQGTKAVSSTHGMQLTQDTSPYYPAWLETAESTFGEIRTALLARDIERLGEAMEHSALCMHSSMFAARPPLIYFVPATLEVLNTVVGLRKSGTVAYATMDAGPHVKVLTTAEDAERVRIELADVPGVFEVISSALGPDARVAKPTSMPPTPSP